MWEKVSFLALRAQRAVQLATDGEWTELAARLQRRFAPAGPGPEAITDPIYYQKWRRTHLPKVVPNKLAPGDATSPGSLEFVILGPDTLSRRFTIEGIAAAAPAHSPLCLESASDLGALSNTVSHVVVLATGQRPTERFMASVRGKLSMPDRLPNAVYVGDSEAVTIDGRVHSPFFRCGIHHDRLLEQPYLTTLTLFPRALLSELLDAQPENAKEWPALVRLHDLILRADENGTLVHVADLWAQVLAPLGNPPDLPTCENGKLHETVTRAALKRRKRVATISEGPIPGTLHVQPKVRESKGRPTASLIIPFRDKPELLERCLASLQRITNGPEFELILVDNGSEQATTAKTVAHWHSQLPSRVLSIPGPFNYAELNNRAARVARGDVLVLLNNDTEIIDEAWLAELVGWAQQPDVGAVGPMLLYGDRSIQHAGVLLGVQRAAIHAYQWLPEQTVGHFGGAKVVTNPIAVTGACLAVQRQKYWEVEGLDDVAFKIAFNDLDLCIKLRAKGYRTLFTPHVRLIHHESKSRGTMLNVDEDREFIRRYSSLVDNDPCYSPHLSKHRPDFRLRA